MQIGQLAFNAYGHTLPHEPGQMPTTIPVFTINRQGTSPVGDTYHNAPPEQIRFVLDEAKATHAILGLWIAEQEKGATCPSR